MYFSQEAYSCRLEWGRRGVAEAAARGDILVIIDVLSFSSATVTAVARGGRIYPCPLEADTAELARRVQGVAAVWRRKVPQDGRFSLSPATMLSLEPGMCVVLASPNGATCSHYGRSVSHLLVGSLLNAQAVADAVASLLAENEQRAVSVIACGERWHEPSEDGTLRFALEDYLGAGAILSSLDTFSQSPEAQVCVGAFRQAREQLPELLQGSSSGQELIQAGFPQDVEHAARLDLYSCVPVMREGFLEQL
jgi:2-phosphosulfolactate phosphatase